MKIGIITFHRALNYGAVLQAYALNKFLKKIGVDSQIIDYRCNYIEEFYKPIKANPLKDTKKFIREIVYYLPNKIKRKRFTQFIRKHIDTTVPVFSKEQLKSFNKDFDIFITGSDQVWNYKWSGFDKSYFLDFADEKKKYSYAASFGFDCIPEKLVFEYKKLLNNFQKISVREATGAKIIKQLLNKDSNVSLDPTMLLSKQEWESISKKPNVTGYVLLYTLETSQTLQNLAKKIALEKGLEIVRIVDTIKFSREYKCKSFLSPEEFLGLFMNAEYVVTNSFHGLMFSCIFEKNFYVAYQEKVGAPNSRIEDFLTEYGLLSRIVNSDTFAPEQIINYEKFRELINIKLNQENEYFKTIKNQYSISKFVPISKDLCCGCASCTVVCPKNAITMKADDEGFLYPTISSNICVNCGLCSKHCPFYRHESDIKIKPIRSIVAKNKNISTRKKSRSGGAFVSISDKILEDGGVVYGVKLNDNFYAVHSRAETKEERDKFCGSKYVQSDINTVYKSVLKDLNAERKVLFSGTACQIDGLKSYLNIYANPNILDKYLYTCDIICHGVVSPLLWKDNLDYIKIRYGRNLNSVNFRDKQYGWNSHIESYNIGDKSYTSEMYTSVFYDHCSLRPSCYKCPYASLNRISDITLADAWGISSVLPEWNDNLGVSLLLINSEKGEAVIENIKDTLEYTDISIDKMLQPNMQYPTLRPKQRENFWEKYKSKGFVYVAKKCLKSQRKIKRINKTKSFIVVALRKLRVKK